MLRSPFLHLDDLTISFNFYIQRYEVQMSYLVCLLVVVNELHILLARVESFVILKNSDWRSLKTYSSP